MRTRIIGYGNPMRRDDGVGWYVVEQLELLALAGVDCGTRHQLEVELAESLRGYDLVIFVDAATPTALLRVQCRAVAARGQASTLSHCVSPEAILGLCRSLNGRAPPALLFSVRGIDFEFGDTLSPAVEAAAREVVRQIASLVRPTATQRHPLCMKSISFAP